MSQADRTALELKGRIEGRLTAGGGYGAGVYFYWALAHHVSAGDVLFADVSVDRDRSNGNERYGRVFVITPRAFIVATYEKAADAADGDPRQEFGTTTITVTQRPTSGLELSWTDRSLRVYRDRFDRQPAMGRLEQDAIRIKGDGWVGLSLPSDSVIDGDDYVDELLRALDLKPANPPIEP